MQRSVSLEGVVLLLCATASLLLLFLVIYLPLTHLRLRSQALVPLQLGHGHWAECRIGPTAIPKATPPDATQQPWPTSLALLFIVRNDLYFAEQWRRWIRLCSAAKITIVPFIHSASGAMCQRALSAIEGLIQVPTVESEWCHIAEVMGTLVKRAARHETLQGCLFASESCVPCSHPDVFRRLDLETSSFFLPHAEGKKASMWCYMTKRYMTAVEEVAAFPRRGVTLRGRSYTWGSMCSEEHIWLALAEAFRLQTTNAPVTFECWDASRLDLRMTQLDWPTIQNEEAAYHPCTFTRLTMPFLSSLQRSRYIFLRKVAPNAQNAAALDLFLNGLVRALEGGCCRGPDCPDDASPDCLDDAPGDYYHHRLCQEW